ncbi:MAG: hypothetical protein ABI866_05665 [Dokdonella sp.]
MDKNEQLVDHGTDALRDIKDTLKAGAADVAAEARDAATDMKYAAGDAADLARETGSRVETHARAAAGSVKVALSDAAESAGQAARDFVDFQRANVHEWKIRANEFIRAKPAVSFAAAAAVGFLISVWLRGSKR